MGHIPCKPVIDAFTLDSYRLTITDVACPSYVTLPARSWCLNPSMQLNQQDDECKIFLFTHHYLVLYIKISDPSGNFVVVHRLMET